MIGAVAAFSVRLLIRNRLNPNAWRNPGIGELGGPVFYGDYGQMRRPNESMSFGRIFRIREGLSLSVRAEFTNIFNRAPYDLTPTETNFGATQTTGPGGRTTGGFGRIDPNLGPLDLARTGSIVGRIRF